MHFIRDFSRTLSACPCGRAQRERRVRSNIASVMNCFLEFRSAVERCYTVVLTGDSSYISSNVIYPFCRAKNATATALIFWNNP